MVKGERKTDWLQGISINQLRAYSRVAALKLGTQEVMKEGTIKLLAKDRHRIRCCFDSGKKSNTNKVWIAVQRADLSLEISRVKRWPDFW